MPLDRMTTQRLDLVLKADRTELPGLMARVGRFAAESGIPADAAFKIELAIDELANNVIDHGYRPGESGEIRVSVTRHPRHVAIDFSDDAPLFDPFGVAEPDTAAPIEARPPRGLGIHLVRKVMTESRYSVEGGENRIHLDLALDIPPEPPR